MESNTWSPRSMAQRYRKSRTFIVRLAILLAALVVGANAAVPTPANAADTDIVRIPDAALKALVNFAIDRTRSPGHDVTVAEAQALTVITSNVGGQVADLTGLEAFTNLTSLSIPSNGTVSDLTPIAGLTKLTSLSILLNRVGDLSPLAGMTEMRSLNLVGNRISDISPLAGMTKMGQLHIDSNQISDISAMAGMTEMTAFSAQANQIKDISALAGMTELGNLDVRVNQITDASPLAGLADDALGNAFNVQLSDNQIRDLSPFGAYLRNPVVFGQKIYVGPYPAGGVTVLLKEKNGTPPVLAGSTGTYDGATGLLTVTDPTRPSVSLGSFTVFFSAPPADPSITGTPRVGQRLTAVPGSWVPSGETPTYEWLRNGAPIPGATARTYTVSVLDLGARLRVRVSTSNARRTSAATDMITTAEPELPAIMPNLPTQSGVVGDPTNPGITLTVAQLDAQNQLVDPSPITVTASVAGTVGTGLTPEQVTITGTGAQRSVAFAPTATGTTTVTFTATGTTGKTATAQVTYSVSKATSPTSRVLQGFSDTSAAIAVGDGDLLVADDEESDIGLYNPAVSGPALAHFPVSVPEHDGEIDFESAARNGGTIYWLGSHGNSKGGDIEENRSVVFATRLSGSGANATITPIGTPYNNLRTDLVTWDRANGDRLGFALGTGSGVPPDALHGFNIEGAEFAPDNKSLYLGFRSPVVPAVEGGKAVIVPVTNIKELTTGLASEAEFGEPILLDLGGMSIRDIRKNAAGEYLILGATAGTSAEQALFAWSGDGNDPAFKLETVLPKDEERFTDNPGAWEGFGQIPDSLSSGEQIRLIMDQGYSVLYDGSTRANKDDSDLQRRKARTDIVTLAGRVGLTAEISDLAPFGTQAATTVGPAQFLTITNTGAQKLRIGKVYTTDEDAASAEDFLIVNDSCEEAALGPDDSCQIALRFAPGRENVTSTATLVIESNLQGAPTELALTGTSTKAPGGPKKPKKPKA